MRVSIFTPSHDPQWLWDAYNSIKRQPFDEWVILHNGLPQNIDFCDDRVKQYNKPDWLPWVGVLKREACELTTGDILIELDHDDLLIEGAVEEVRKAFANPEVGFVYSNAVRCNEAFEKLPRFADGNGWEYRSFHWYEKELDELVSFDPHPMNVSRIWFAPDHLRAFRRDVYEKVGKHRPMKVLDDLDLMCRMYLETKFHHINKPLYLYRVHGANSFLTHNAEIQQNVMRIHESYIERMALKWAYDNNLAALDLGARFNPAPGYVSVDLRDADVCCDLQTLWPFENDSVGVIRAYDVFEHLPDIVFTMRELHRVLAPDGIALIQVPSTDGRGAFQDPTHVSFWNENSFLYYTDKRWSQYIDTPVRFQAVMNYTTQRDEMGVCWTKAHLRKLTDGVRVPGPVLI